MKRILAWVGIFAIVLGFAALIYFVVTGAPANMILATLFCMLVVPVIIYGLITVTNLLKQNSDNDSE